MMKKYLKQSLVFLVVISLLYSNVPNNFLVSFLNNQYVSNLEIPNAYAIAGVPTAAVGDGRLLYGDNVDATPKTRVYTTSSNTYSSSGSTALATANIAFTVSKESPTEDVTVMATQSSTGKLDIMCRSGSTWTKDISGITVGTTGATRRFDVEFEKTSGVAMVLYSNNVSGANELSYYRKTGAGCGAGSWTGPTTLDPTRITGTVLWVGLAAQQTAGSNVLGAAFSDTSGSQGGTLESMIWTGSAWGSESPAASAQGWSDSSIKLNGSSGANNIKAFDLTFETLSGKLMVVWGTSTGNIGTNGWRFATCAAGTLPCTWSAAQTPAGLYDDSANIACASDPGSNSIAVIGEGNSGPRVSAWAWDGSSVVATANGADTTAPQIEAGNFHVDIDWVVNGTQRMAVGVFSSTTGPKYIFYNQGMVGWRYTTTNPVIPGAPASAVKSVQVTSNPIDRTKLLATFTDASGNLWSKLLNYDGSNGGYATVLTNWSNADGGVSLATVGSVTSQTFWTDWVRTAGAAPATATVSGTAGSKIVNLNSGDTSKYINDPTCTTEGTCAAFKIAASGGTATITSIKVTETGTVNANTTLANPTLIYDTDANFANGTTGTFGTQATFASGDTVTFANAGLAIPSGSTYYFYLRFDLASGAVYPSGGNTIGFQINTLTDIGTTATQAGSVPVNLVGTTTVKPVITSYTNTTESALNYSAACTNCGVRLGPGAAYRQSITINGYGFGTDPGLGSRNSGSNKIEIIGGATGAFADDGTANTNISAWSNTAITVRTDTNITGNNEPDWGINYGGANSLRVTAGGQTSPSNLNLYIFPQVTSITVPTVTSNAAREYNASDSDGLITLNGTRFGSGLGTGWVRILGCDSSTCSGPSSSATTNSWSSSAITVQVPTVIADNIYTGSVIMQQGTGANSKGHTYTASGFRILPRVSSVSPTSGIIGDTITVSGNHFCQNNGTCPVAFDGNNAITFYSSVAASTFTSWSDTSVVTKVPVSAASGALSLLSNTYQSNTDKIFNLVSPIPNNPTNQNQFNSSELTVPISIGGVSSSTNTYLTMTLQVLVSGGTLYPQIEYQPIGTSFSCTGNSACAQAVEGTGKSGPGPIDCSSPASGCAISISPNDGVYHWQARVRHNVGGADYYSNWVSYGGNGESATDFQSDKTGAVITFPNTNTCTDAVSGLTNTAATIGWSLNKSANGQVEYSKNSDLSSATLTPSTPDPTAFSHSLPLTSLTAATTYYFRVKSTDSSGNTTMRPTSSPFCSFVTPNITYPVKTVRFYVGGNSGTVNAGTVNSSTFQAYALESNINILSSFVELSGFSAGGGQNNISMSVNSAATSTYAMPSGSNFKLLYPVSSANLNFNPVSNTFNISPSLDLNITSAELVLTYSYTP